MSIYGNPVMMGGSGGGGGSDAPVSTVAVVNNAVVSDGVTITAQPAIVDGEMSATSSLGLAVNIVPDIVVVIEMDYTYDTSTPARTIFSFGGSNTDTGVLGLNTATFSFYGNGLEVSASISMSAGTPHHLKIEISATDIVLYIDGSLAATLTNARFASVLSYLLDRSKVTSILWNQSWHGEYNTSKINNLSIKLVTDQ